MKHEQQMGGRSAKRDRQLESSWSRDDHEDGGPTIQLPAAEPAAPLTVIYWFEYIRGRPTPPSVANRAALANEPRDLRMRFRRALTCACLDWTVVSQGRNERRDSADTRMAALPIPRGGRRRAS